MKLKLVKKENEAKGTKSFFFEPEKPISWLPGQYYYYTLPKLHYDDSRGPTRHFTISSSPTEGGLLRITTRIRENSGYKRTLDEISMGDEVEGEGPSGTFILDESEKSKTNIFLAGGIGITPFRCFIKYNLDKDLKIPMNLIYSNSVPEEIVFRQELESWSESFDFIKTIFTVSKPEESKEKWKGETGRIDDKLVSKILSKWKGDASKFTFWVVGPPPFVSAMEDLTDKMKIPSNHVLSEKFTGY